MSTPYADLGHRLPWVPLSDIIDRAFLSHGVAGLYAGCGILGLAFVWRCTQEMLTMLEGGEPRFLRHIFILALFCAGLSAYRPLVTGCIRVITQIGLDMSGENTLDVAFGKRYALYVAQWSGEAPWHSWGRPTAEGLMNLLLETATLGAYGLVHWVVMFLRCAQTFTLAVIIAYGPIALGFASFGGMFAPLAVAWFWSLVEVSAWGITMEVLNHVFTPLAQDIPNTFELAQELLLCLTILALMVTVPVITSMLVRGQSAASLGITNMIAAHTVMQATQRHVNQMRQVAQTSVHTAGLVKDFAGALAGKRAFSKDSSFSKGQSAWMRDKMNDNTKSAGD